MSGEQIEFERNEIAEIIASSFDHNGEKWDASDFEWSACQLQQKGFHKQSKNTIELLEKQLAFWKHHSTVLSNELTKAEETSKCYAELLDKTEEELNAERVKSEGEWLEIDDGILIGDGKHLECSECGVWKKDRQRSNFCPNCGARMKGGAE